MKTKGWLTSSCRHWRDVECTP